MHVGGLVCTWYGTWYLVKTYQVRSTDTVIIVPGTNHTTDVVYINHVVDVPGTEFTYSTNSGPYNIVDLRKANCLTYQVLYH